MHSSERQIEDTDERPRTQVTVTMVDKLYEERSDTDAG